MPRYSKTGTTVYTSANKNLTDIPWKEVSDMYSSALSDATEKKQARLDRVYSEELEQMEQDYADTHEAPYEGNFSDKYPRPKAVVGPNEVFKQCKETIIENFIKKYKLINSSDWFMPQIITLIGNMKIVKNDNGLISGLQFRNDNFKDATLRGIYWFLMIDQKSSYLKLQYKVPNRAYCSLVPTIMYAIRLVKGVPYTAWDPEEIKYVVAPGLCAAMTTEYPEFTDEQLLEQRSLGLTTVSTGVSKNPLSYHTLNGQHLNTGIFKDVPEYTRIMLTQIWCAHPDNRTKYMILDPYNWDSMPKSLIKSDVLTATASKEDTDMADGWGA